MTAPDLRATPTPSAAANDNVDGDVRLCRLLLAIGVYVVAVAFGWCLIGIAVAVWIFDR